MDSMAHSKTNVISNVSIRAPLLGRSTNGETKMFKTSAPRNKLRENRKTGLGPL